MGKDKGLWATNRITSCAHVGHLDRQMLVLMQPQGQPEGQLQLVQGF
jgi:hypothetical protein